MLIVHLLLFYLLISVFSWLKFIVVLVYNSLTQILLDKLESCWLGRWKGVLLGQSINEDHQEAILSAARQLQGKITNLCGSAPDIQLLEVMRTIWSFLWRPIHACFITLWSQPNCINYLLETLINIFSLPLLVRCENRVSYIHILTNMCPTLFILVHYLNFGKLWFTSSVLAQSVERVTAKQEVAGSIPGAGPNNQALKISEKWRYSLCTARG